MVGFPRLENEPSSLLTPESTQAYEELQETASNSDSYSIDSIPSPQQTVIADLGRITELSIDKLVREHHQQQEQQPSVMAPGLLGNDNLAMTLDNGSDNLAVLEQTFNSKSKNKMPMPDDNFVEPAIVKKVAAGLKSSNSSPGSIGQPDKHLKHLDIGSLSSGSSIITISSVASNDPVYPDDNDSQNSGPPSGAGKSPAKKRRAPKLITDETWYHTALQTSVPFFIAGAGTIGAGIVLAQVTEWTVFKEVSQILILVPALLGLKGNLDMCLASRLSTQANLGNMKGCREIMKMIIGNVALVQVQAIVAAFLVACFATLVGWLMDGTFVWKHSLLMMTAAIFTATSSCFILDFVMIAIIMGAKYFRMNPDNLATPLAASIGDLVSITVLSTSVSFLYTKIHTDIWILYSVISLYLILLPIWIVVVLKNKYTKHVLTSGWIPVISALFISGLGGLILDQAVDSLKGFVIFQPIINGIGGNLVSIQSSRISTMFHQSSVIGILPPITKTWVSAWKALFHGVPSAKTARLLIFMAIPGHTIFSLTADRIHWGHQTIDPYFMLAYLSMAVLQVMLLLYIAHIIIHVMWKYKIDPDNSAIPYLTALGDLLGSVLLALAFIFLRYIDKDYGEYSK